MAGALTQFLEFAEDKAADFAGWDCGHYCAAWLEPFTGIDMAPVLQARYSNEAEAEGAIQTAGGLRRLFDLLAPRAGLRRVSPPSVGCIGVIYHPGVPGRALGAVYHGDDMWSSVASAGGVWMGTPPRVLAAYEVAR